MALWQVIDLYGVVVFLKRDGFIDLPMGGIDLKRGCLVKVLQTRPIVFRAMENSAVYPFLRRCGSMKIIYYKGEHPNFGDELNTWMWPQLLPDFFDEDSKTLFIGIGSTLGANYPVDSKKIVFGAGFEPNYNLQPDVHTPDWHVYFVRGPRTAQRLGLAPELSIGDSAILLRTLITKKPAPQVVSFVPHWESLMTGQWENVCRMAGINLIDPRRPLHEVIDELLRSKVVITEAMHGAIVSDALRVPWVPLLPINSKHRNKWYDWAEALQLDLKPYRLWPSSFVEAGMVLERKKALADASAFMAKTPLKGIAEKGMQYAVAKRLQQLASVEPSLSLDAVMDEVTQKMVAKVSQLGKDYRR